MNYLSVLRAEVSARNLTLTLVVVNLIFNIVANASFKYSANSATWGKFFFWQIIGNLAGLVTVITLTALLKFIPLEVAFPVTTGLAVIGVQVFASHWFFHEEISPTHWLGTLFIAAGIVLFSKRP